MGFVSDSDFSSLKKRLETIENQMGGMTYDMREVVRNEIMMNADVVEQSQTQFGLYTGLCVDTIDIWKQNRIRFYSPIFHTPNMKIEELPWAHAVSNMGGFDDCGMTWVPPAGSTVCILFENGSRTSPFYIGTTWHRNRGPDGKHNWGYNIDEYYRIWDGKRKGYLVGPDDGSQVFPPWNTENYNGFDLTSLVDFDSNTEAQRLITYPHIYGFKTPEKHMIKMVDGDAKCNRKWKRFEIMSSCGNWIMLKDDHLHYSGQWAHQDCGGSVVDGETSCVEDAYNQSQIDKYRLNQGKDASDKNSPKQISNVAATNPVSVTSDGHGLQTGDQIHIRDTNSNPPIDGFYSINVTGPNSFTIDLDLSGGSSGFSGTFDLYNSQTASEEDYLSANTKDISPEIGKKLEDFDCEGKLSNRKIIGGHPRTGAPNTTYSYNSQIGANPYFKHRQECRPYRGSPTPQNNQCDLPQSGIQLQSISGHTFVMDDSVEEPSGSPTWDREFDFGCNNKYVGRTYWKSATGHYIEMSDVEGQAGDSNSTLRNQDNFIRIRSATGNSIELNDHTESQPDCSGCPPNIAGNRRGIHLRSTSNHTIDMSDEGNEQCGSCRVEGGVPKSKAKKAYVRIRTGYGLEMNFSDDSNQEIAENQHIQIFSPHTGNIKGPHILRFQESAPSNSGLVLLRVGGNYVCYTVDNHYTVVGTEDDPNNLVEYVTKFNVVYTKNAYVNVTEKSHLFLAKSKIFLLAGEDCPSPEGILGPCLAPVCVLKDGAIRASDRVFASASPSAPVLSIFQLKPFYKTPPATG
jgi:Type VI secretion system/phage-baseplate injector OB domain